MNSDVFKTDYDYTNRQDREAKAVFSVNPSILVTMNDELAQQLVATLDQVIRDGQRLPQAVFAFKQALQADLEKA